MQRRINQVAFFGMINQTQDMPPNYCWIRINFTISKPYNLNSSISHDNKLKMKTRCNPSYNQRQGNKPENKIFNVMYLFGLATAFNKKISDLSQAGMNHEPALLDPHPISPGNRSEAQEYGHLTNVRRNFPITLHSQQNHNSTAFCRHYIIINSTQSLPKPQPHDIATP